MTTLTVKKVTSLQYHIFKGEELVGEVWAVVASLNRPTGSWSYTYRGSTTWAKFGTPQKALTALQNRVNKEKGSK